MDFGFLLQSANEHTPVNRLACLIVPNFNPRLESVGSTKCGEDFEPPSSHFSAFWLFDPSKHQQSTASARSTFEGDLVGGGEEVIQSRKPFKHGGDGRQKIARRRTPNFLLE